MHVYGGLPAPLAALAVLALAAFLALYYAAACAVSRRCGRGSRLLARAACSPRCGCWPSCCAARWFTGFPWGAGGYAHVDGPLASLAPLARRAMASASSRRCLRCRAVAARRAAARCGRGAIGLAVGAAAGLLAACNMAAVPPMRHRRPDRACRSRCCRATSRRTRSSRAAPASRWRWTGTAAQLQQTHAPAWWSRPKPRSRCCRSNCPTGYLAGAARSASRTATQAALIGMPLGSFEEGYTNSVIGLQPGAAALPLRQAPPGALRRIHPAAVQLVHRDDEHPAGRLQPRRRRRSRRSSGRASAWRPTSATKTCSARSSARSFADAAHGAHDLRQRQQHRLVRQHRGHRPAPAHQPHARAGIRAAHDPRHQHRRHGRSSTTAAASPTRCRATRAAC